MGFNEQLLVLQQQYLRGLPATLEQVSRLSDTLTTAQPDPQQLAELDQLLHKLSGSAGTFGLTALSAHAVDLERRLAMLTSGGLESGSRKGGSQALQHELQSLDRFLTPEQLPGMAIAEQEAAKNQPLSAEVWLLEDDDLLGLSLIAHLEAFNFKARLFTSFAYLAAAYACEQP